jgi:hypothetical protein
MKSACKGEQKKMPDCRESKPFRANKKQSNYSNVRRFIAQPKYHKVKVTHVGQLQV